ncbi:cytochrome c oxidase assembly protein [Falsirhodobacter halotolerans]|uniref:cytochrome c oxidase assembly protein n=1 Tax=Falsirhodobacter halotolerans TaxID=1146892 RepID=UPI001FD24A67|nr:cytochrome c oxidase assembly protein [Falsirhodobacter halotolerans]MCJ8141293.1 cytochrome c oxidase assembly protein [Falsirhodobacter halotolerans]
MDQTTVPYCGPAPVADELWAAWNLDPVVILALCAAAALVWHRNIARMSGLMGIAVLAVAFVSPLCALSTALFSARVLHHVLIIAVAAPLIVRGLGLTAQAIGAAVLFHLAAVWLWHMPAPYQMALQSNAIYWLMEASLLGTAIWLWSAMMADDRGAASIIAALATLVQMGMLGAILTFANRPLFEVHFLTTDAFGLSPIEDQQLAGLLMWVPAAFPYLGFALWRLCDAVLPRKVA